MPSVICDVTTVGLAALSAIFPRLERVRSINFILLPEGGLYEVCVVIGGAFYELGQEHSGISPAAKGHLLD